MLKCSNMQWFVKKDGCSNSVIYIDSSGFVYCAECAFIRNRTKKCYKLSLENLEKLNQGKPLTRYELRKS